MLDTNKRAEQWVVRRAVWIFYGTLFNSYLFLSAVNIGLNLYNTSNIWTGFYSFICSSRSYGEIHMPQWNLVRSEFCKFKSSFLSSSLHITACPLSVLKSSSLALIFRNNCTYIQASFLLVSSTTCSNLRTTESHRVSACEDKSVRSFPVAAAA